MTRTKEELLADIRKLSKRIIDHKYSQRESAAVATHRMVDQAKLISLACSRLTALLDKEAQSAGEKLLKRVERIEGLAGAIDPNSYMSDKARGIEKQCATIRRFIASTKDK